MTHDAKRKISLKKKVVIKRNLYFTFKLEKLSIIISVSTRTCMQHVHIPAHLYEFIVLLSP